MGSGGEIINLNVGGQRFSTSRHTLTAIPVSPPFHTLKRLSYEIDLENVDEN
jgi:hypothetical protein